MSLPESFLRDAPRPGPVAIPTPRNPGTDLKTIHWLLDDAGCAIKVGKYCGRGIYQVDFTTDGWWTWESLGLACGLVTARSMVADRLAKAER